MPAKKSAKNTLAGEEVRAEHPAAIAARQKDAIAAANQIRKDFKNLKLSKSAKLFNDCIAKNKEFEAELKLVRLELLAMIHAHEESNYDPKVVKFALKEMLELIDDMATLQPCWGHAAERCCTLLRVNAGDPQKGLERCEHAISCIEQSRPTDDKVFLDVFSQDHEANLHRLLDFDCKDDVQYLIRRLQLVKFIAKQELNKKEQQVMLGDGQSEDESGDKLNQLQTAVINRRNALVQLYKQGLRRPPKWSKAVNGSDDKDDQAKQIRRKMVEQEIVRVKAMQLCREARQEPQVEEPVDDQTSKRAAPAGSDAKSHSERLQRKLAAKKEALDRHDANGQDSADLALRFLKTLPAEERAEALRLPIERLEAAFQALQQAQMEQIGPDGTVHNPPTDAIPSLLAAAEEHAKGNWLARSWTQGDFQRFGNRQEYLSILLTMIWRLLLQKCKTEVLSLWTHRDPELVAAREKASQTLQMQRMRETMAADIAEQMELDLDFAEQMELDLGSLQGAKEKDRRADLRALEILSEAEEERNNFVKGARMRALDFRDVLPWLSDVADNLPDLSKRVGEQQTLLKKGEGPDEEVLVSRIKRYLMSRVEHLPAEFLKKMDIILMREVVGVVPRAMHQNGVPVGEAFGEEKSSSAHGRREIDLEAIDGDEEVVRVEVGGSNGVSEGNGVAMGGSEGEQHVLSNGQGGQGLPDLSVDSRHRKLHSLIVAHANRDCLEKLALESFKLQVRDELEDLQRCLSARVESMLVAEAEMPLDCERLLAKGCSSFEEQSFFSKKYGAQSPEGQEEIWFSLQDRFDEGQAFNLALLSETVRQTKLQAMAAWKRADAMQSPEVDYGLLIDSDTRVIDFGPHFPEGAEDGNAFSSILRGQCMTAWLATANHVLEQGESRPFEEVFDMYERCELQTRQTWNERLQEFTHRGLQWTATCRTLHQVRLIHRQVIQMRLRVRLILENGFKLVQMQQNLVQFLTDVCHFTQVSRGTCHYLRQGLSDHATVVWYRLQDAFRHMDTVRDGQSERLELAEILDNDPEVQRDIESKIANSRKIASALDEQIGKTTQLRERLEQFAREPDVLPVGLEFEGMEPLRNFVDASLQLPQALCQVLDQIDGEANEIKQLMRTLQSEQMEFDLFRDLEAVVDAGAESAIVMEAISGLALALVRDDLAARGRAEEEARSKMEQDSKAKAAEEAFLQEEKRKEEQDRQKREKQAKKRDKEKQKKKREKEELERKQEEEKKVQKAVEEKDGKEAEAPNLQSEEREEREAAQGKAREQQQQQQQCQKDEAAEVARAKPAQGKESNASEEESLQKEKRKEEQERQKRQKAAEKRDEDKEKKRRAKKEQEEKRAAEGKAHWQRGAAEEERRQTETLRQQKEVDAAAAQRHARDAEEQAVRRQKELVEEETREKRMQELARRRKELEEEDAKRVRERKELDEEMRILELNELREQRHPAGGQERKQRGEASEAHSRAPDSIGAAKQHVQGPGEQGCGVAAAVGPAQAGNKLKFFLYAELAHATRNFDVSVRLGSGGFGTVYRARSLRGFPSRQEFAVKRLDPESTQGQAEFDREVQVLGSCRHESLLPLIGFSTDHELLCLVFPLMQASVQDRLFPPDGRGVLGWVERVRACASAAKALQYLHTPDPAVGKPVILHRDIKPSNLLLDADGLVRLGDFGLARMHRESTKSHMTLTQVGGTNGFIDPKYMQTGHCEPASDAYSLGVTVLVLLTGWEAYEAGEDTVYDRCDGREPQEVADPRALWPADKAADMLRVGMGLADPRKRFRMTVAEALEVLMHAESDPDVDSVACERECLLCMALPRAVRLGCGHATYCRDCLAAALSRPSPVCPHCSRPVVVDDIVTDDGIAVENTWVMPVQRPLG